MQKEEEFIIRSEKLVDVFYALGKAIEVDSTTDCRRSHLHLDAFGEVMLYQDSSGIDCLLFNLKKPLDWALHFIGSLDDTLNFFSVAKGSLEIIAEQQQFKVDSLQSTIQGGFGKAPFTLSVRGEEGFLGACIAVNKRTFFAGMDCKKLDIPDKLLHVVEELEAVVPSFLFQDIFHLPIINALQEMVAQADKGLLNTTFVTSRIHEILFLQLNEYQRAEGGVSRRLVRQQEKVQQVKNAETILTSRLQDPPTIPELARMAGMNQQTLKAGFRQLYGNSINQYLNEKRLEQAGMLIEAGELSLREVALEVGYNNPGYFSRKFREKYGVSPRYYGKTKA